MKPPTWTTPRWVSHLRPVLLSLLGGFATVAALIYAQGAGAPLWSLNAAMLLPAVVTFVFVRTSRRRWYRWVVILALAQVVYPWVTAPLLLVGTAWALWRSWFVERHTTPVVDVPRVGARNAAAAAPPRGRNPSVKTAPAGLR